MTDQLHAPTIDPAARTSEAQQSEQASLKQWIAVSAMGLATFCAVTTELLPVGLLPEITATYAVTPGTGGMMITTPSIVAAVAAPLVVLGAGRIDRRILSCWLMLLFAAAHAATALAPSFTAILVARFVAGICIGGIWAIAGGLAPRLVPARDVALATSVIFGGVAAASVLGVPLGTLIGELVGWRAAFAVMSALCILIFAAIAIALPALPAPKPMTINQLTDLFGNTRLRAGLIITLLMVGGHFAAYTFVSPILQNLYDIDGTYVSGLLLAYGLAGLIGNFVGGILAGRSTRQTVTAIALALFAILWVLPSLTFISATGVILIVFWGFAYGGVSVSLQTWMMKSAPSALETATALYVSLFNVAIALGALLGGLTVDGLGLSSALLLGGGLAAAAAMIAFMTACAAPTRAAG